jgi:carbamate kinase
MGPKVEAAVRFLERGGKRAIIGHLREALPALRGETGTHIVFDEG